MEEEILLRGKVDLQRVYAGIDKLRREINTVGNAKLKLGGLENIFGGSNNFTQNIKRDMDSLAREFQRSMSGKFSNRNFLNTILDPEEFKRAIGEIEKQINTLGGKQLKQKNFGFKLEDTLKSQIADIELGFVKTGAAAKRLQNEIAGIKKEAATAQTQIARLYKDQQKAEGIRDRKGETINNMRENGRTPSQQTLNIFNSNAQKAKEAKDAIGELTAKLKQLQVQEQNLNTEITTGSEKSAAGRERIKVLEQAIVKVEELRTAYKSLGESGKGMASTPAGLQEQLATVKQLIATSELYKENEQERIALYQAQNRLQQAGLQNLLDQAAAAKMLAEATGDVNGKDAQGRDVIPYKTAESLINQYGGTEGIKNLPDTRQELQIISALLNSVQGNVSLTGEQFQGLGQIIEAVGQKLNTSLIDPTKLLAQYAKQSSDAFKLETKRNDLGRFLDQQADVERDPLNPLDRQGARGDGLSRIYAGGNQKLKVENTSARAPISPDRALALNNEILRAAGLTQQATAKVNEYFAAWLKAKNAIRGTGSAIADLPGGRLKTGSDKDALQPLDRQNAPNGGISRRYVGDDQVFGVTQTPQRGGAIVPYDEGYAKYQSKADAKQKELKIIRDQIAAMQQLVALEKESYQVAQRTLVEGGTGADIADAIKAFENRLNNSPAGSEPFNNAAADLIASRKQQLDNEFEKLSAGAQSVDVDGLVQNIEGLASRVGDIPALWKFLNTEVRSFVDLLPAGSEGVERIAAALENAGRFANELNQPISLATPKTLDEYSQQRQDLDRRMNAAELGTGQMAAPAQRAGFLDLEELDRGAEKLREFQQGGRNYFAKLQQEQGGIGGAFRKIFSDFGNSTAGIDGALQKIGKIRGAIPVSDVKAFDAALDAVIASLGLAGERGSSELRKLTSETEAAAVAAREYAAVMQNLGSATPNRIAAALAKNKKDLGDVPAGSQDAGRLIADQKGLGIQSIYDGLANLRVEAQLLSSIQAPDDLISFLQGIESEVAGKPELFRQFSAAVQELFNTFKNNPGFDAAGFETALKKPLSENVSGGSGGSNTGEANSVNALSKAYNDELAALNKLNPGTAAYEKQLKSVVKTKEDLARATKASNKLLSEETAKFNTAGKQGTKEFEKSSISYVKDVANNYANTTEGISQAEAEIRSFAGSLELLDANIPIVQAIREELERLGKVKFKTGVDNIETDLTDLGELKNDAGTLLKTLFKNPKGLRGAAQGISAGSRRGISEALIGGGFPLLFGQGALASGGGFLGGILGPALLGSGGGFAGGIVGTAIGQAFQDLAANANELGNAMRDPIKNLQQLSDAAVIGSKALKGQAEALSSVGRGPEAEAIIQREVLSRPGARFAEANSRALNSAPFRAVDSYSQDQSLLFGTMIDTPMQILGKGLKGGLAMAAGQLIGGPFSNILGQDLSISGIADKLLFKPQAETRTQKLDKIASDFKKQYEYLSFSSSRNAGLSAYGGGLGAVGDTRQANDTDKMTLLEKSKSLEAARVNGKSEDIARLEVEITQEIIKQTNARQAAVKAAEAQAQMAQKTLAIEKQLTDIAKKGKTGAGLDLYEAGLKDRQKRDENNKALKLANKDMQDAVAEMSRLGYTGGTPKTPEQQAALNKKLGAEQVFQEVKKSNTEIDIDAERRTRTAFLEKESAKESYEFRKKSAGLTGANLEAANEQRQLDLAQRDYNQASELSLKDPTNQALRDQAEGLGDKLKEAGISMRDNLVLGAGEAASRFISQLQASGGLQSALNINGVINGGGSLEGKQGAVQGEEIKAQAFSSILAAGDKKQRAYTDMQASAALSPYGIADANLTNQFEIASKEFATTVIAAGNTVGMTLQQAAISLGQAQGGLARTVMDPMGVQVFGRQKVGEMSDELSRSYLKSSQDRFTSAFGFNPLNERNYNESNTGTFATTRRLEMADYLTKVADQKGQVDSAQALISSLSGAGQIINNAATAVQASLGAVAEASGALAQKNWGVYLTVNGQTGQVNLG